MVELPIRSQKKNSRIPTYLAGGFALIPAAGLFVLIGLVSPRLTDLNFSLKNEWDFLKSQPVDFDSNGTGLYPFHAERSKNTIFIGDSAIAQYAQRISLAQEDPKLNGAIFVVGGGCIPLKEVYTDDQNRKNCQKNLELGLSRALDTQTATVVIGGSWNWYFLSKGYYYKDGERHIGLETDTGRDRALNALSETLKTFKRQGKQVYLLLGNPIIPEFDPHVHIQRLTKRQPLQTAPLVPLIDKQQRLRSDLLQIAAEAGAKVVDPVSSVCEPEKCRWITPEDMPIFKDASHFNPDWAASNAKFIDETLLVPLLGGS